MPRRTNPFQSLSASIMAIFHEPECSVAESVLDKNPRTGVVRELDIRIVNRANPQKRILVECRAHARKQDVQWIDALDGKARSLGFPKSVAVSSSGFTRSAIVEARDRGIETLHLKRAAPESWREWMFAIETCGLNINFDPVIRGVECGVPSEWVSRVRSLEFSRLLLLDGRRKLKIPLHEYIASFRRDPTLLEHLRARSTNDAVNRFDYKVPCGPGIGLGWEPDGPFIPLMELILRIELVVARYSIPLQHVDVAGSRILVGDGTVLGRPTRLVLQETPEKLKVMLEQRVPIKKD